MAINPFNTLELQPEAQAARCLYIVGGTWTAFFNFFFFLFLVLLLLSMDHYDDCKIMCSAGE